MRRLAFVLGLVILAAAVGVFIGKIWDNKPVTKPLSTSNFILSSPAFANGRTIPAKFTCKDQNISPPLGIASPPAGTVSLALIMHDPDAPGGDWLHWTLWNIAPTTTSINENSQPNAAVSGTNDFGKTGYGGPCPPSGTHHYIFDLYALDKSLELPSGASRQQLESAINGHTLSQTQLTGLFGG